MDICIDFQINAVKNILYVAISCFVQHNLQKEITFRHHTISYVK